MFERDYLMRVIALFAEAVRRSWTQAKEKNDPRGAADSLEAAIGDATDIDGAILLSLAPESIAGVMQVSGVDPKVTEQIARSLILEAAYLDEAGEIDLAQLRREQGYAIAEAYGVELTSPDEIIDDFVLCDTSDENIATDTNVAAETDKATIKTADSIPAHMIGPASEDA